MSGAASLLYECCNTDSGFDETRGRLAAEAILHFGLWFLVFGLWLLVSGFYYFFQISNSKFQIRFETKTQSRKPKT
ncbi:MAG: hypothetical protein DMF63_06485 [Acidobacteria bacterium]|nr:MAG: hypothetical protein DMF63_06485 [Acidobacteriota bacterium]